MVLSEFLVDWALIRCFLPHDDFAIGYLITVFVEAVTRGAIPCPKGLVPVVLSNPNA